MQMNSVHLRTAAYRSMNITKTKTPRSFISDLQYLQNENLSLLRPNLLKFIVNTVFLRGPKTWVKIEVS